MQRSKDFSKRGRRSKKMTQTAEKQSLPDNRRFSAEVVPMRPPGTAAAEEAQISGRVQSSRKERLREARERAADALISTKESIAGVYRQAYTRACDSFIDLASASHGVVSRARNRAEHIKREHPLQLLAVVTGAAFAIGMAVRIWGSRHHA